MNKAIKKISIIIPVYNEEANIIPLYNELKDILGRINKEYEIIYIDDHSQDNSKKILKNLFIKDRNIQLISLLGNHGQSLALSAGFKSGSGDVIIAMDGDGQHDPKYIPAFVRAIEDGYDLVGGWKIINSGQGKMISLFSKVAHFAIAKLSGSNLKYSGATMKAYRRDIVEQLELSGDLHRFMGALIYFKGIKIKEIPIEIRAREGGKSNYSLIKIFKVMLDLILLKFLTKYSKNPFRLFGFLSSLLLLAGFAGIFYVFYVKLAYGISTASNVSALIVSSILIMGGIQLLLFGLLAELISRIYHKSNHNVLFIKKEHLKHGRDDKKNNKSTSNT